jgi:hypothetical protein
MTRVVYLIQCGGDDPRWIPYSPFLEALIFHHRMPPEPSQRFHGCQRFSIPDYYVAQGILRFRSRICRILCVYHFNDTVISVQDLADLQVQVSDLVHSSSESFLDSDSD